MSPAHSPGRVPSHSTFFSSAPHNSHSSGGSGRWFSQRRAHHVACRRRQKSTPPAESPLNQASTLHLPAQAPKPTLAPVLPSRRTGDVLDVAGVLAEVAAQEVAGEATGAVSHGAAHGQQGQKVAGLVSAHSVSLFQNSTGACCAPEAGRPTASAPQHPPIAAAPSCEPAPARRTGSAQSWRWRRPAAAWRAAPCSPQSWPAAPPPESAPRSRPDQ